MKTTYLIKKYAGWIHHCARRYCGGLVDIEDLEQSIKLHLHEALLDGKIWTTSQDAFIKSFIISRAVDCARKDSQRPLSHQTPLEHHPPAPSDYPKQCTQYEELAEYLMVKLGPKQAHILLELVEPTPAVQTAHENRQKRHHHTHGRCPTYLTSKDVAVGLEISPATVSRALTAARELYSLC